VWCKSKRGVDEIRLFELRHKIFLNSDEVKSEEEKSQKQKMKKNISRIERTIQVMHGIRRAISKWL